MRLLADLIRGKKVEEARTLLDFSVKRGAKPLRKLLDSAVASAIHNFQLEEKDLWISKITVDEGPKLKRWQARARGRATEIQKKTSHITLVLEGEKKKRVKKTEKEEKREKKQVEEEKKVKSKAKIEKPKAEKEIARPKIEKKGWKKIFRRKSI